ncbi:MAG: hypothetical protein RBS58_09890 [Syntrophales bacterium]|jgi:hypothetical protein|nr:hypothetical protein [Syntrophales bacterium]MDX9922937.1 hypothetical protein [Syntrophales bacterium]
MGEKSRLKRERHAVKAAKDKAFMPYEAEFEHACTDLRSLFARYTAEDVTVSLNVSDLWIPNISSQIKHTLAFSVSIAMAADSFTGEDRIESYSDFKQFIEQVHAILPSFPMLEDYVPETDWGEVKFQSRDSALRIFYGGAVERISDFVTAFNLIHGTEGKASQDMHLALLAQHHVLSAIDRTTAGARDEIERGHIEIPSEAFWKLCRDAILSLSRRSEFREVSRELVTQLSFSPSPRKLTKFSDSVMDGTALPFFLVEVGTSRFPLSLRNAASTVIQYWSDKNNVVSPRSIAGFVSTRLADVIKGPLQLITRTERLPFIFSAAFYGGTNLYLVINLGNEAVANLPGIESGLKTAFSSGDWAFQQVGKPGAIQVRTQDGTLPSIDQLILLAVLSSLTTVTRVLKIPKTRARIISLADFVTIFDAIKDIKELERYWAFVDAHSSVLDGFCGPADLFAAFLDSNALLVDGAVNPSMITLDPHWGSTWRYRMLSSYWGNVPLALPDVLDTVWNVERDSDGLYKLLAKSAPALCWGAVIDNCAVHFMLIAGTQPIELEDGNVLEVLIHCLADSLNQRQSIIANQPLFQYRQIVTECKTKMDSLVSLEVHNHSEQPLFSEWQISENTAKRSLNIVVQVNLQHVRRRLTDVTEASFEVEAALAWIAELSARLNLSVDSNVLVQLRNTSVRKPRFLMTERRRTVDVPEYPVPHLPSPEHYKLARRDLAVAFKELGAKEGKYELDEAKPLIDAARDNFRALIHHSVSSLRRFDLIKFCIEQLDMLIARYDHELTRIQISLNHEVTYDRAKSLAEARDQLLQESRNYRYLLECCLSMPDHGSGQVSHEIVVQLIASIDWLMVLYNASDVLHNGLDVAGLELDNFFIPNVHYTTMNERNEAAFGNEAAEMKLGIGLNEVDEVQAIQPNDTEGNQLDQAFYQDTGVSLFDFFAGLHVLAQWPSATGNKDLRFSYSASREEIGAVLSKSIAGMNLNEADRVIALASLKPAGIRRLLGKSTDESDVPLWEHNKRGDRYTIKPVISIDEKNLIWGAASSERAARTWVQSLSNGYMPADFNWPKTKEAVRNIKERLERQLEVATTAVLARGTPHAEQGIDFKRRYPKENFKDVGDFDGLAYWPETNQWIIAECKYNQPAFCLKDARRLRDRIFGTPANKGQFDKIERRREFLFDNMEKILTCLGWPPPPVGLQPTLHELYVSRDIYWWMRNPPYAVSSYFIRIDQLDNWLRGQGLFR